VKLELPLIKSDDNYEFEIELGFYHNGARKTTKGKDIQPYHRAEEEAFDHSELEFDAEEDEADAV
jgi:hypothetical protein